ncbi:MAG TPA: hypothetical protein VFU82_04710 [Gammaproteobacteria bacterium]|nr:hypothetical protein [Gammaproteobacteria bacterium]
MSHERILPFKQSKVLSLEQIQEISAAGMSWGACLQPSVPLGKDFVADLTLD